MFFKEAIYLEFIVVVLYFYGWWSAWQMKNEKWETRKVETRNDKREKNK